MANKHDNHKMVSHVFFMFLAVNINYFLQNQMTVILESLHPHHYWMCCLPLLLLYHISPPIPLPPLEFLCQHADHQGQEF